MTWSDLIIAIVLSVVAIAIVVHEAEKEPMTRTPTPTACFEGVGRDANGPMFVPCGDVSPTNYPRVWYYNGVEV